MAEYNRYRIKVNKQLIDSFYSKPKDQATQKEIAEIYKVIQIVLNHYYSKYYCKFKELRSWAMLAILERHQNYNPVWSSYNFVYRIARNEIGNKLSKYGKEEFMEELPEDSKQTLPESMSSVEELLPYLSGDKFFKVLEVPKGLIVPLMTFIMESTTSMSMDDIYKDIANTLVDLNY